MRQAPKSATRSGRSRRPSVRWSERRRIWPSAGQMIVEQAEIRRGNPLAAVPFDRIELPAGLGRDGCRLRRRPRRNQGLVGTKYLDVGMGSAGLCGLRNAGWRDDDRSALNGSADILGCDGKRRGNNQACRRADVVNAIARILRSSHSCLIVPEVAGSPIASAPASRCIGFTSSRATPRRRHGEWPPAKARPIAGQCKRTLRHRGPQVDLTGTLRHSDAGAKVPTHRGSVAAA